MNIEQVTFQLQEALLHLQDLVSELRDGQMKENDAAALAVDLGHIHDHICAAWNAKDMSIEDIASFSQDEFERLVNTVPNFHCLKTLGPAAVA